MLEIPCFEQVFLAPTSLLLSDETVQCRRLVRDNSRMGLENQKRGRAGVSRGVIGLTANLHRLRCPINTAAGGSS
jgi:hypothetical protein